MIRVCIKLTAMFRASGTHRWVVVVRRTEKVGIRGTSRRGRVGAGLAESDRVCSREKEVSEGAAKVDIVRCRL